MNVSRRMAIGGFLATVIPAGCRRVEPAGTSKPRRSPEDSEGEFPDEFPDEFTEQLKLGRRGRSDRLEVTSQTVTDEMASLLTADDDWLGVLILDSGAVSDGGTESIAALPNLWHLRLRQSPITDDGFKILSSCDSLTILNLPQCAATAKGVAELARLPALRNLRLGGGNFGADVASEIARLETLRDLHLIGIPIDDEGLRAIAALPKLRSLYLDDSDVTQAGWDWLFETHPRLHVHVNQKHLDRDDHDH